MTMMTAEQLRDGFDRQVRMYAGLGTDRMLVAICRRFGLAIEADGGDHFRIYPRGRSTDGERMGLDPFKAEP